MLALMKAFPYGVQIFFSNKNYRSIKFDENFLLIDVLLFRFDF